MRHTLIKKQVRTMKVAAYCRVSTELDDQQNSLKNQQEYFASFIQKKEEENWKFAGIYADEGISGTSVKKREAFQQMMEDAKTGKIDLILTKEVSRFARNTVDTLIAVRTLRTFGVGVFFILDHIDTRENDGEIRLTLMASMAQEESRKISQRVKWGQKRQMERGIVFGRRLFGYELDHGVLSVCEAEAEVVQRIYRNYVKEKKKTGEIARELNAEGYLTARKNPWTDLAVSRILKNEKYVGDLVQKKTYTADYLTHAKRKNDGAEEFVIQKDHHPAIISRQLFLEAQARLSEKKRAPEEMEKYRNRYWCSGKVRCGCCGSTCVSRVRRRKDGSISQSWLCANVARYGRKRSGCAGKRVADPVLYQGFLEAEEKSGARLDGSKDAAGLKSIIIGENDLLYLFRDGRVWRTALQK